MLYFLTADGMPLSVAGDNALMDLAWRDFIAFAFQEPQMVAAFNAMTGRRYQTPGVRPSDTQLADDAAAFVLWVTRERWGMDYAPAAYRAEHGGVA